MNAPIISSNTHSIAGQDYNSIKILPSLSFDRNARIASAPSSRPNFFHTLTLYLLALATRSTNSFIVPPETKGARRGLPEGKDYDRAGLRADQVRHGVRAFFLSEVCEGPERMESGLRGVQPEKMMLWRQQEASGPAPPGAGGRKIRGKVHSRHSSCGLFLGMVAENTL